MSLNVLIPRNRGRIEGGLGFTDGIRECLAYVDVDSTNKNGNTALHIASLKGYTECIRMLIAVGANLDIKNSSGDTSLHVALLAGRINVAILLIQSGADINSKNAYGDSPIHIAAKEGYTKVVHSLCSFGCSLNIPNDKGLYPLHLAAKNGHVDVIRYLCLYGSNVDQRNLDGIKAEILAFKYGHYAAGELLNKLRIRNYRESYINQLIPTNKLLPKFNVKFLGCSNTGKTTLIRSLKAGYFLGLFSKSKSQSSVNLFYGKYSRDSSLTSQMEIDLSTLHGSPKESPDYQYTQGIEIHQASFGAGEVNLWDFSGLNTYYFVYDYFVGDSFSFYVIVFNLSLSQSKQHYQCSFWLTFLKSRLHISEKNGIRILLVGTHADMANVHKDVQGVYYSSSVQKMQSQLAEEFPGFIFEEKVILCDAHVSNSRGVRDIKNIISEKKVFILQDVGKSTQFLERTVQSLRNWRKEFENFPVISWEMFVKKIHKNVNPVAGSKHISELIIQLQVMAEIYYLRSKSTLEGLIILDLNWLCSEVIGELLSLDTIGRVRITGCYTEEDFQSCFPLGPADKVLDLLSTLQICTQCENDGEIEFEFPCFNFVEKLDGLWSATDTRYNTPGSCYAGVLLKTPYKMLQTIFARLQVQFRRATIVCQNPNIDLYQWFEGSKLCLGNIESCITLEDGGKAIEVKIRGTESLKSNCFYLLNEILNSINEVLLYVAPGLLCERFIISSEDLRSHVEKPFSWPPDEVFLALSSSTGIHSVLRNPNTNGNESLLQLIGCGCDNVVTDKIIFGCDLPVTELPGQCLDALAQLLDPPEPHGKDWCLLGVKLNLSHKIATLDNGSNISKTLALLDFWSKNKEATIGNLIKKLTEIGREEAAKIILLYAPLYKVPPVADKDGTQKATIFEPQSPDLL